MKKFMTFFLIITTTIISIFTITAFTTTATTATNNFSLVGDTDLDGDISIKDVTLVQKHVANIKTLVGTALKNADVNKDNKITIVDATTIQKQLANVVKDFDVKNTISVNTNKEDIVETVPDTTISTNVTTEETTNQEIVVEIETNIVPTESTVENTTPSTVITVPTTAPTTVPSTTPTTTESTIPVIPQIGSTPKFTLKDMEVEVFNLLNEERAKEGLAPLEFGYFFYDVAEVRAKEAAVTFSHTRPNNTHWSTAFDEFNIRIDNRYRGENLARFFPDAKTAMIALMNSPGHRANILHPEINYVAIAVVEMPNNPGSYALSQMFLSDAVF